MVAPATRLAGTVSTLSSESSFDNAPWADGMLLSSDNLNDTLGTCGPWNALRNGDCRAATRTDASNATFAFWTATGTVNASSTDIGEVEMAASSTLSQVFVDLLDGTGTNGDWRYGIVASSTGTVSGSVKIEFGEGRYATTTSIPFTDEDLGATSVLLAAGVVISGYSTSYARISITTDSTSTGTLSVFNAFATQGQTFRGHHQERATSNIAVRGVLATGGLEEVGNTARILPIHGIPITTSASGTAATNTVDLAGYLDGLIESGDRMFVWVFQEDDDAETGKVSVCAGAISGATLTVAVYAASGLTFTGGTMKVSALVMVYPTSDSQSNRAYPYA